MTRKAHSRMADEVNGAGAERVYQDAFQAAIGERVTSLGRRQTDLESEMRSGFKQVELSITSLANETRQSIANLSSVMADRSRPQWQAIGVALTFVALLGALAYWPIRESTGDLKAAIAALSDKVVTQAEMQWRTQRGMEDRQRTEAAIVDIRKDQVPRAELQRVWDSYDQRFIDVQRQLDTLAANSTSTFTPRDALMELKAKQDRIEAEIGRLRRSDAERLRP